MLSERRKTEREGEEVGLIKTIAREPARNKSVHSFHPPISPSISPSLLTPFFRGIRKFCVAERSCCARKCSPAPPTPRVLFVQTLAFIRYTNILNRVALSEVNAVHNQKPGERERECCVLLFATWGENRVEERNKAAPAPPFAFGTRMKFSYLFVSIEFWIYVVEYLRFERVCINRPWNLNSWRRCYKILLIKYCESYWIFKNALIEIWYTVVTLQMLTLYRESYCISKMQISIKSFEISYFSFLVTYAVVLQILLKFD